MTATTVPETNHWPDPQPLEPSMPIAQALELALLPKVLQPLVKDVSERMSVPPDMPAAVAIACLAASVNRRARIQPLTEDTTWQVTPCIWAAVVAEPGQKKSPTIAAVCQPLKAIERSWREEYEQRLKAFKAEDEDYRLKKRARDQMYTNWLKRPDTAQKPIEIGDPPKKPLYRRLIVNDATPEKLHELFSDNPGGLFLQVDELVGWLASLDKKGYETARTFFLTCWAVSGGADYTVDRITRETVAAEVCLSLLGGIQPDMLKKYLGSVTDCDGLLQRLQVLVWPEPVPFKLVDRAPNQDALDKVKRAFEKLLSLDPEPPLQFRFAPAAQKTFNQWCYELEAKVQGGDLHSALAYHLSKYRSLMPALALLFELIDRKKDSADKSVSVDHTQQAIAFCAYLESHARKVYSHLSSGRVEASYELSQRIKEGKLGKRFSLRDLYRKGWSGLEKPGKAKAACDVLMQAGWLRLSGNGGRLAASQAVYVVNPKVQAKPSKVKS